MFARLSIRTKIVAAFGLMVAVAAILGLFSIRQMELINERALDIQERWLQSVRLLGDVRAYTLTYRGLVRAHILANDAAGKAAMDKNYDLIVAALNKTFDAYEPTLASGEERDLYRQFKTAWNDYFAGTQTVLNASRKGDEAIARDLHVKIAGLAVKADEFLAQGVLLNNKGAEEAGRSATETYRSAYRLVLAGLALTIAIGLLTAFTLTRDVSRGIASVIAPMRALSGGDFLVQIPHQGERTEIGTIADALQVFKDALVAKKAADDRVLANSQAEVQRSGRIERVTLEFENAIGGVVGSLTSSSVELEAAAGTLMSTAAATEAGSEGAANASKEVSANINSVAGRDGTDQCVRWRNQQAGAGVQPDRPGGGAPGEGDGRQYLGTGRRGGTYRRRRQSHRRGFRADQPFGAERHHRSRQGGRGRSWFRGGRLRSEGARNSDVESDGGDRGADPGDAIGHRPFGANDNRGGRHDRSHIGDILGNRRGN